MRVHASPRSSTDPRDREPGPARRALRGGVWLLILGLGLTGCTKSVDERLRETFESAPRDGVSVTGGDLRLALCGWLPPRTRRLEVRDLDMTRRGDDQSGTGELSATLVSPSGARCDGRVSFRYRRDRRRDGTFGYPVREIRRMGPPPAWTGVVAERAQVVDFPGEVDATLTNDWPELDGVRAAAFAFDVPAGRHAFRLPGSPGFEVWFVLYHGDEPVRDPQGGITNVTLPAGRVQLLLLSEEHETAHLVLGG